MSDRIVIDAFREVRFYSSILKDSLFAAGSLFTFFILRWPSYWLFIFHIATWVVALFYMYSDENSVIFATLAFFLNSAIAIFDGIITFTVTCFLSNCCVSGRAPFAFGLRICDLKNSTAYLPLVWYSIAILALATLSGAFRSSSIVLLRKRTRVDVALGCLYVGLKIYIVTWPEVSWPFLFWAQTIATIGLVGTATLFSYISKFVAYLLVGIVIFLDLVLLLGSYGLLGSPTINASTSGTLTFTRHLLSSYLFDPAPFINPIHEYQLHLNTTSYSALNSTVSFNLKYFQGMSYQDTYALFNYTQSNMNAVHSGMQGAQDTYVKSVSTATQQYTGSVSQSTFDAMTATATPVTTLSALIASTAGTCCSSPKLDVVTSSDSHTQLFQTQFLAAQTKLLSYHSQYPKLVTSSIGGYTSAVASFGNQVTGFASYFVKDLTRWERFTQWFLGSHHENWQYTPLSSFDFGVPVPQLVKDIAASVHGLAIFIAVSLFFAIWSRTAKTIYNFSELAEVAKDKPKLETGVSTSVSIGATGSELRKRSTLHQEV